MAMNDPHDRERGPLGEPVQGTRPADIPVESVGRRAAPAAPKVAVRHGGGSPLRWIIPLLLLLVIGFALTRNRRAEPEVATVNPSSTQAASGGEVAAATAPAAPAAPTVADPKAIPSFVTWADKGGNAAAETDPAYTAEGLRLMADALTAASVGKGNYMSRIADIRKQADQLTATASDDRHAEYAHKAFVDASNLIAELRGAHEGNAALSAAAEKVQPGKPLGPQGTEVHAFFREAAKALNGMKPADSTATK